MYIVYYFNIQHIDRWIDSRSIDTYTGGLMD